MDNNITYNLSHVFKRSNLDNFFKAYLNRNKESSNPILKKIEKISDTNYKIEYSNTFPDFLILLLTQRSVEYTENIIIDKDNIEINSIQSIGNYTIYCNTIVKCNNTDDIILTSLIKINKFPKLIEPMLKSYSESIFRKQRNLEESLMKNSIEDCII